MSNSATPGTAGEQSRQSEVVLAKALLELLTVAQSKVEFDRQAARACLSRATALLQANLERGSTAKKTQATGHGQLPRWQAKRLATYIEENLDRPIGSAELVAITGTSTGHFFRTFKATFGLAPFNYIARKRIEHAQRLMRETRRPICQIALECGLCDQSHLTRLFRRLVGTTPGEWRREYARDSFAPVPAAADASAVAGSARYQNQNLNRAPSSTKSTAWEGPVCSRKSRGEKCA